jgi:hypothetical protein
MALLRQLPDIVLDQANSVPRHLATGLCRQAWGSTRRVGEPRGASLYHHDPDLGEFHQAGVCTRSLVTHHQKAVTPGSFREEKTCWSLTANVAQWGAQTRHMPVALAEKARLVIRLVTDWHRCILLCQ